MRPIGDTQPDSDVKLQILLDRYSRRDRAVTVNFRRLVDWAPMGDRASHYLHPYPAKLLPHIPAFFLSNSLLSSEGDTVLDPFCGSGTVLLESLLHGRNALGADSNPLARLIASVKVSDMDLERVPAMAERLMLRAERYRSAKVPPVVNIAHWFIPRIVDELAKLRRAIDSVPDEQLRDFFLVCFSACVRRVSLADPRVSVPVRLRLNQYPPGHPFRRVSNSRFRAVRKASAYAEFASAVAAGIPRLLAQSQLRRPGRRAFIVSRDARCLPSGSGSSSVDLVITSPPYAGAQKYVRASSLSIGWLGLEPDRSLREIEDDNIGREHFATHRLREIPETGIDDADKRLKAIWMESRIRAVIAATYLVEMRAAFAECVRVLKPGGRMIVVAGNNSICGRDFKTNTYLRETLVDLGLAVELRAVDSIRSRGLMTRRNATASVITREWVTLFRKAGPTRGRP